jgi:hypothetical protein
MTTCQLRLAAADRIERLGHRKGTYGTSDGPCCLLGALLYSLPPTFATGQSWPLVSGALADMGFPLGHTKSGASQWNDAPERTAEDVVARLREGCQP